VSRKVQPFQDSGDQAAGPADEVIDLAAHPLRRSCTAEHRSQVVAVYEEAALGQNAAVLRRDGLYQLRSGNEPRRALVSPAPAWPPRYAGGTVASWNTWFNVLSLKCQRSCPR
jgi:hypothetical protein